MPTRLQSACVLSLLYSGLCFSQTVSSSIKGVLVDPSGESVAGAACTLVNQATGASLSASSAVDGSFTFPNVLAGTYTLSAQATGFKALEIRNITVTASEIRTLGNLMLQIGEVRESVSVTAESAAVALQLASAEKSGLITGDQLNSIAIKGRDLFALLQTIPGVVDDNSVSRETTSVGAIRGTYINGGRQNQKNFSVDGITDMDIGANESLGTQPNMDAIAEVKILTSNYQAEYGRNSGGAITVITKSGSRQFHGTAYDFYRHESLNANSFFNNRTGTPKSPYRYRISGYSLGGPVYIPRKFNAGKNKLFFFFSQEYTGVRKDYGTMFVNTPTELERRGDFSRSFDVSGARIPVRDPLNGQPFSGNMIPAERFNKLGASILGFFPVPNYTDPDPRNQYRWNYRSVYSGGTPRRNDVVRVDANLKPSLTLYYRFIQDKDELNIPWGDWKIGNTYLLTPILSKNPGRGHVLHVTKTFSPTLVNEATVGYSLADRTADHVDKQAVDRARMGNVPQWFADPQLPNYIPDVQFGGQPASPLRARIGVSPYSYSNPVYVFMDNVNKVWRSHNLKAGMYVERAVIAAVGELALWRGRFDFSRDTNNPFDSNHSFANALLGNFLSYTETTARTDSDLLGWNVEWYLQDNWRVTKRLTLDLGIRFYHMAPMYDRNHNSAAFDPTRYDPKKAPTLYIPAIDPANNQRVAMDPLTRTLAPAQLIGQYVPGSGEFANGGVVGGLNGYSKGLYTRDWLAYGPRFGFAYDLFGNGRTALRGGFGLFHDTAQNNPIQGSDGNPPVTYTPTLFNGNLDTFSKGAGAIGPTALTQTPFGHQTLPATMNYSFGVQHQIWGTVVDVSYVGALSRHLLVRRETNPIAMYARFDPKNQDPTRAGRPLPDNFFRPYTGLDSVRIYEFTGTSNYNSLQIGANRRLSRSLQFGVAYTRSKTLGVSADDYSSISPYFSARQRNYGPIAYDRPNVFVVNYMYNLPKFGAKTGWAPARWVLDDWQVTGITSFVSGAPFTPGMATVDGQDITGSTEGARITVAGNPRLDKSQRTFFRNLNTDAFARTPLRDFGNAGVGILYGPGVNNWDIAMSKRVPFAGEERFVQFRAELFNAWNHTQFSGLFTTARFDTRGVQVDPNFGAYSSARNPRIVQLSLKVFF